MAQLGFMFYLLVFNHIKFVISISYMRYLFAYPSHFLEQMAIKGR